MQLQPYEIEHLNRLRSHLAECTVLLKTNGDFPLSEAGKIAAFGSGVRNTIKGGTGSGEVNSRFFTTVEQGLEDAGFTITTKAWLEAYEQVRTEAKKAFHKEIKARAKANHTFAIIEGMGAVMPEPEYELSLDGEGDVAIYVLSRISGEGNDRRPIGGDILLSTTEQRDILALHKKYKKFMLVLNVGGPVDLSSVQEVENILVLSQLGVETGAALADILLGKTYPSGKLATTWSAWKDYSAIGEFGDQDETRYKEGIYVGYRYFDSLGKRALYPFGYGLGYTTFSTSNADITAVGETITVTAKVKNTGAYPGKEVVQVYVSAPQGELDKAYQDLAAFVKTRELQPNEEEVVTATFQMSDLTSYHTAKAVYVLEQGNYIVRVGNSSEDTRVCGLIHLEETVEVCKVRNTCGTPDFADFKPSETRETLVSDDVKVISVGKEDIPTQIISYDRPQEMDDFVKQFTDKELAFVNIGAFDPKGGIVSVIGNASRTVAGAAGESTGKWKDRGLPVIVMADGPAGVRLSQKYYRDEKGAHAFGETMPTTMLEYLPKSVAWFFSRPPKVKKDREIRCQYATAIPIGTAIAQSWNLEFARDCGDIVGTEMEIFGVHLWLAPALNIHRSICCGRNFEYFSEDPVIGGLFSAALTNGVQAHPGCGTTIKHYAANNQETNRYGNNSQVSERAMREIYLRGFEICVKRSQPLALMTSYNLLNGVHTAERRDLTEDILRCEYGFKGIVMTDWVIMGMTKRNGKYKAPDAAKVATAGSDLFMPGSNKDYKQVLKGLKNGTLSREQLQISATRVYRMAKRLEKKE